MNYQALNQYKKNRTQENLIEVKRTRATKIRTIKESKKQSWQKYITKINPDTPSKNIWERISKIAGKNILRQTTTITKNNQIYTKPQDIVNVIADTFEENSSNKHYSATFLQHKTQVEERATQIENDNNHPLNQPFNMWELNSTIKNLKLNKTPGPDQIHNEMIIHLPERIRMLLLNIYNHIWFHHVFPKTWKEAIIIPILKPNKDQTLPTSYRPIALTNTCCKIMENNGTTCKQSTHVVFRMKQSNNKYSEWL